MEMRDQQESSVLPHLQLFVLHVVMQFKKDAKSSDTLGLFGIFDGVWLQLSLDRSRSSAGGTYRNGSLCAADRDLNQIISPAFKSVHI